MAHPGEHLTAAAREIGRARRRLAGTRASGDRLTRLLRVSDALLTSLEELNLRGVVVAPPRLRERVVGVITAAGIATSSARVQDLLDGLFDAQRRILRARRRAMERVPRYAIHAHRLSVDHQTGIA